MKKIILFFLVYIFLSPVYANTEKVYIIPIKGVIDLGLSGFVKRCLEEAKREEVKTIILEINTFGGRVDAAVDICKYLEEIKPIRTIAFVDDQAWSAGALISLACSEIYMSTGASIGSAEPRAMGFGEKDELTDEKVVSAIRAKFKSIAEENKHPENLALAMVDKDIEIKKVKIKGEIRIVTEQELEELKSQFSEKDISVLKTINPKGKLLNLTAKEAKEYGLAKEVLSNRKELLNYLGIKEEDLVELKLTWSENLVRFLTHPIVSPLLLSLGFLGLLFELKMPGWGISGTLGLLFLALFFWGHYLVGLANWTEILVFFIGLILLALEIFVIPGFGITGILGIGCILAGIFLAMIKHPFTIPKLELNRAFYTMGYAILITILGILLSLKFLPKSTFWKKIVLSFGERKEEGFQVTQILQSYVGKKGKTISILRPAGKAIFEDRILDVITEGEFIDRDKEIQIIRVEANKIFVKEV